MITSISELSLESQRTIEEINELHNEYIHGDDDYSYLSSIIHDVQNLDMKDFLLVGHALYLFNVWGNLQLEVKDNNGETVAQFRFHYINRSRYNPDESDFVILECLTETVAKGYRLDLRRPNVTDHPFHQLTGNYIATYPSIINSLSNFYDYLYPNISLNR